MLNPVKLFILTTGAVVVLAVTPYLASNLLPGSAGRMMKEAITAPRIDSSQEMAELPTPRPGAPVQALRTKMTEPPSRKPQTKSAAKAEEDLPRPRDDRKDTRSTAAKAENKPAEKKPVPTATPKVELPFRADVQRAQEMLTKLAKFDGKTDGKLGPITQAAIKDYQKKNQLTASGEPNNETLKKMESSVAALASTKEKEAKADQVETSDVKDEDKKTHAASDKQDDPQFVVLRKTAKPTKSADIGPVPRLTRVAEVKQLQEKLEQANSYSGEVDGRWGKLTIAAMKEFQEKNKLEVTGKPNKETWEKLNEVASAEWEVVKDISAKKAEKSSTQQKPDGGKGVVITDSKPAAKKNESNSAPLTISAKDVSPKKEAEPAVKVAAPARKTDAAPLKSPDTASKHEAEKPEPTASESVTALPVSKPETPPLASDNVAAVEPVAVDSGVSDNASEPPSLSEAPAVRPGENVVVKVNADAGSSENKVLATPATVSTPITNEAETALFDPSQPILLPPDASPNSVQSSSTPATASESPVNSTEEPAISVRAPKRNSASEAPAGSAANTSSATSTPVSSPVPSEAVAVQAPVAADSELPPAASRAAAERLEKELAETQARIAMVRNDPRYELSKYAPAALETVNSLVSKVKTDVSSDKPNAASTRESLRKIEEELERAKQLCLKKKAEQKVEQVDEIYSQVKERFAEQIGNSAKSKKGDSASKLADLMAKIDTGYTAMKADFKQGNYDPIVERCDGFKLQIEILGNEAAREYLETALEKSKKKLSKEQLAEIEDLRSKNKYMEAATVLDAATKSATSSSSGKRRG